MTAQRRTFLRAHTALVREDALLTSPGSGATLLLRYIIDPARCKEKQLTAFDQRQSRLPPEQNKHGEDHLPAGLCTEARKRRRWRQDHCPSGRREFDPLLLLLSSALCFVCACVIVGFHVVYDVNPLRFRGQLLAIYAMRRFTHMCIY